MPSVLIKGWKCNRCGYEWLSYKNKEVKPIKCANPKCLSPYWDKERVVNNG